MERMKRRRRDEKLRGWGYFCHAVCASVLLHLMILAIVISDIGKDMTYALNASLTCIWQMHTGAVLASRYTGRDKFLRIVLPLQQDRIKIETSGILNL